MSREPISPMAELEVLGTHCQHLRLTRVAQTLPTLLEQGIEALWFLNSSGVAAGAGVTSRH
jgi:tripartite-type tricarboxylate transporter receptor subunit TctC